MRKVLIVTTVSGFVPQFEMNNVKILKEMRCEIHYAANFNNPVYTTNNDRLNDTGILLHQVDFVRSPYSLQNILAYKQLLKLMRDNEFDLVHCHTPMGAVIARLAAKNTNIMPVIYTAHGFHFYKGASFFNWLVFYPIEKCLAKYTDALITINQEDYKNAQKFKLRNKNNVFLVNGIGIHTKVNKISSARKKIRDNFGVGDHDCLFISVGELSKRKNHQIIIKALANLGDNNIKYMICGDGATKNSLKHMISELRLDNQVILAGYQENIKNIMEAADVFVFPSKQEGLSVALMEAMAFGMPIICSDIRGNHDLIENEVNGLLVPMNDVTAYSRAIRKLVDDKNLRSSLGRAAKEKVKEYDITVVDQQMRKIYKMLAEGYWK